MTTGSISRNEVWTHAPDGFAIREWFYRSWSGADSPSVFVKAPKMYTTAVRDFRYKIVKIRKLVPVTRYKYRVVSQSVALQPNRKIRFFIDSSGRRRAVHPSDLQQNAYSRIRTRVPYTKYIKRTFRTLIKVPGSNFYKKRIFPPLPKRLTRRDPHPYTLNLKSCTEDWFEVGAVGSSWTFRSYFHEPPSFGVSSYWTADDDTKLVDKIHDRIAGNNFHAGVALAEVDKTFSMIGDHARRISRSLKLISSGNVLGAINSLRSYSPSSRKAIDNLRSSKKQARSASGSYLEYTYGVQPLLQDVSEGAAFLGFQAGNPATSAVSASRSAQGQDYFLIRHPWYSLGSNGSYVYVTYKLRISKRIKCRLFEVDTVKLLGLTDISSIAWERLPYSFVADWFVPIGTFLRQLNLARSIQGLFITSFRVVTESGSIGIHNVGGDRFYFTRRANAYEFKRVFFQRTVSNNLPVPQPRLRPIGRSASGRHCLNAVALLTQLFTRR